MKKILFELNPNWVLKHRNDDVLPIEMVQSFLSGKFSDAVELSDAGYNSVTCTVADGNTSNNDIISALREFLSENYGDFRDFFLSELVSDSTEKSASADEASASEEEKEEGEGSETVTSLFEKFRSAVISDSNRESSEASNNDESKLAKIAETIDKVVTASGAEFKVLANELINIAPQIRKNNAQEVIAAQRYLFSIGDGCGLQLYLKLLRDIVNGMRLDSLVLEEEIISEKIPPEEPKATDIAEYYLSRFKHSDFERHVVGVDISEWMQRVNSQEFRRIVEELLRMCHNDIIVFIIPFVEKEVLETITESLNDLMFIRKLSFPPFTMEEIRGLADAESGKFGFTMDDAAWENFRRRIIRESSDGRFHGVDTVDKVVHEMLYAKQLKNAVNGVDETVVHGIDTVSLCPDDFDHGKNGMEMLENMVGTEAIKQKILEIISQIKLARLNSEMGMPCLHMRFLGNPGTGKTTVARIIGKILKENGILRIGEFHEHSGRDFCGRYIGETAPKTSGICRDAYGSVLFIDEAYSLFRGGDDTKDFGREALDTLIAEMENHRSDLVVIMAGYTDDMDKLMEGNAGLLSRMPYSIEFPNFTREQLFEIFCKMTDGKIECAPSVLDRAKEYFLGLDEEWIQSKQFSNGRFVRNLFERCCAKAAMRCQLAGTDKISITEDDFERSVGDKDFLVKAKRRRIGFGG